MFKEFIIITILIISNGFFAAAELGIISVNSNKIKLKASNGNKSAKLIKNIIEKPEIFLSTIQIVISLIGIFLGAYAGQTFVDPLSSFILSIGINVNEVFLKKLIVFLITILLSYFTLVFGELIPKRLSLQNPEKTASIVIYPVIFLSNIFKPFVLFLSFSTKIIIKTLGINTENTREEVTKEEIMMLIDEGSEKGNIEKDEMKMINNIFEFNDTTAEEIATHRVDILALDIKENLENIINIVANERYSRIPIYENDIDHIIGVLHIKDIMKAILNKQVIDNFDIKSILRKPHFIPNSKKIHDLFKEMKKDKIHLSIVIDEYGGTLGIITMEDLIEEVMGNILDEYDIDEAASINQVNENIFVVNGKTCLEEVQEYFNINLPINEYDTIGGFIIGKLGRIPKETENAEIICENLTFKVSKINGKRIDKIIVSKNKEIDKIFDIKEINK